MTRRPDPSDLADPFWREFAITLVVSLCLASVFIYKALQTTGRPTDVVLAK